MRRWGLSVLAVLSLLIAAGVVLVILARRPLPLRRPVIIEVHRGEAFDVLAHRLAQRGIVSSWWLLDVLARLSGMARNVRHGQYRLRPGMNDWMLLERLVSNHVVLHRFTIIPGETFATLAVALGEDDNVRGRALLAHPRRLVALLGSHAPSPEGLFLPETYEFPRGTSVLSILRRAARRMQRTLLRLWKSRDPHLPLRTPYQALILASIVERESAYRPERPRIAQVFLNRLRLGMPLDSDPTVIYAMGDRYHYPLTAADLSFPSPWNTYLHRGLPPTPICNPSPDAIEAVLHPAPGRDLYFVVTNDGHHVFARTLAGQDRNIRRYEPRPSAPDHSGRSSP